MNLTLNNPTPTKPNDFIWLVLFSILFFLIHSTGDHAFNKTNTLKMVLLATSVTILLLHQIFANNQYQSIKVPLLLALPIFATVPGFIYTEAKYSYSAPYELTSQILCVMWAAIIYTKTLELQNYPRLIWSLIPSIIFVCIIALLQQQGLNPLNRFSINLFETRWLNSEIIYLGPISRIQSTFGNTNYFASFLIQLVPLVIFLLFSVSCKKNKSGSFAFLQLGVLSITLIMMVLSLYFTETRAAITAFLISSLFFFVVYFIHIKQRSSKYILLILILIIFTSIPIYSLELSLFERFSKLMTYETWNSRFIAWDAAWASFIASPWVGSGIGSSYQLFFEFVGFDSRLSVAGRSYNHAHSEILEILQEGGILGIIAHIILWVSCFYGGWRIIKNTSVSHDIRLLTLCILSGLVAYHLHGLFSVAPRMIVARMIAYTLIAILLVLITTYAPPKKFFKKKSYSNIKINTLFILIVCTIWFWLIPFTYEQHTYAKTLVDQNNNDLIIQSKNSNDIYLLNEAAIRASKNENGEHLEFISNKISNIFPNYRNTKFHAANAQFLQGNISKAGEIAKLSQAKDLYHPATNLLLTQISLKLNNSSLYKEQLEIAIKRIGCHNKIINCTDTKVNVIFGTMATPVQFLKRQNRLDVFIDNSFIKNSQKQLLNNAVTSYRTYTEQVLLHINSIGNSPFFTTQFFKKSVKPTTLDFERLAEYLRLSNSQINMKTELIRIYKNNTSKASFTNQYREFERYKLKQQIKLDKLQTRMNHLEIELKAKIQLTRFIQSRNFLISFSNWLATITNKPNEH